MAYLVFESKEEMEKALVERDKKLGYPEPIENLRHVGRGKHAPLAECRAMHYTNPIEHFDGDLWAIKEVEGVKQEPTAEKFDELPEHWQLKRPLLAISEGELEDGQRTVR